MHHLCSIRFALIYKPQLRGGICVSNFCQLHYLPLPGVRWYLPVWPWMLDLLIPVHLFSLCIHTMIFTSNVLFGILCFGYVLRWTNTALPWCYLWQCMWLIAIPASYKSGPGVVQTGSRNLFCYLYHLGYILFVMCHVALCHVSTWDPFSHGPVEVSEELRRDISPFSIS